MVSAEAIADALTESDPERAADLLVELALVGGGPDNVTVIVADVMDTGAPATERIAPVVIDPDATGPIGQMTREMPRIPLPPIPEEPGAPTRYAADPADDDEDELEDDDLDDEDLGDADRVETPRTRTSASTQRGRRIGRGRTRTVPATVRAPPGAPFSACSAAAGAAGVLRPKIRTTRPPGDGAGAGGARSPWPSSPCCWWPSPVPRSGCAASSSSALGAPRWSASTGA